MPLVHDGEDDDGCCCDNGPHEEADFPPEFPRSRSACAALRALACQEGIFFRNVAVAADVAGATREEGPVSWHGGSVGVAIHSKVREKRKCE
jgi:hypothetical protein